MRIRQEEKGEYEEEFFLRQNNLIICLNGRIFLFLWKIKDDKILLVCVLAA